MTSLQRSRRAIKDILVGLGASEGWTDTFVSAAAHDDVGLTGPAVRVANPLDAEKPFLRRSLMPGLLGALSYNAGRRQPEIRLFEVGVVFSHPDEGAPRVVERAGAGGTEAAVLPGERELLAAVLARDDDDARDAVASWHVIADALHLDGVRLVRPGDGCRPSPACTRRRSAPSVAQGESGEAPCRSAPSARSTRTLPHRFGLTPASGAATTGRRVGWLEIDLGLLFDEELVPRRVTVGGAVSRFPSSDVDLAFVVEDRHPADAVADALRDGRRRSARVGDPVRRVPRARDRPRVPAAWPTGCASARRSGR